MYLLCFHVPATHLEAVKTAVFNAGAGKMQNYSQCSWEILGEGQFMPLTGSNAFIGEINTLEKVPEYKVETICDKNHIEEVVNALKLAHPYEVPSYQVWKLESY